MSLTIDQLQIDVNASAVNASSGIDALTSSLQRLRNALKGGAGLASTSRQLTAIGNALSSIGDPTSKVNVLVSALSSLGSVGKTNIGSILNQLKKLPEITRSLNATDLDAFAAQIQRVTTALLPLSTEMAKVSACFIKIPANIQRAIYAKAKLTASNHSTAKSYGILGTGISAVVVKFGLMLSIARRVGNIIASWIRASNDYVENLNLFTVAMGKYATEAQAFAEKVGELMGIDPSDWMRNQGYLSPLRPALVWRLIKLRLCQRTSHNSATIKICRIAG